MTYAFKAGETYQTHDGRSATIVGKVHGWLIGYTWKDGPIPTRWFASGYCEDSGLSLMPPPKRRIWIAVWLTNGLVETDVLDSKADAESVIRDSGERRIAVLGPIDVEAEP